MSDRRRPMISLPCTQAEWATHMDSIEAQYDQLETWGIEVGYIVELLELVSDSATRFVELLSPGDKARWEQVIYLTGLLRSAGENIEKESAKAMREAATLAELARKGGAA
jgi:hypothetical protein